jgi:ribonucleoside-diphosphate reductase alpha chain
MRRTGGHTRLVDAPVHPAATRTTEQRGPLFRWMGKKFLNPQIQEELGIMSPEVKARLAASYRADAPSASAESETSTQAWPGQTALFNHWEDAVECARCGGRMVRTGSCYTCRDCGTNTGCS